MGEHFHTHRGGILLWAPPGIVVGFKGVQSAQPVLASVVTASRKGLFHTNRGKVAFGTDVIVAARRSRCGASHALLRALHAGHLTAVASVPMMLEYEAVLMRPEQRWATGMSAQDVQDFLDELAALLIPVTSWFLWRPRLRGPDDEMVLDAAINGGAS